MQIAIINGPNLNLLGTREPQIYGSQTFDAYFASLQETYPQVKFSYFQSNIEGELINEIQRCSVMDAVIMNAGAYTHTSIAIADALRALPFKKIIEVHISNVFSREEYRHHSFIAPVSLGVISGFGLASYALAVEALLLRQD